MRHENGAWLTLGLVALAAGAGALTRVGSPARGGRPEVLYLVACVAQKGPRRSPAKDLYRSDWFKKARAYVEAQGGPWMILSAKYGLVSPDQPISPYEQTLNTMTAKQRRAWARPVLQRLLNINPKRVVILAGRKYRDDLVTPLRGQGIRVVVPMEGLGIGQQLGWLKKHGPKAGGMFDALMQHGKGSGNRGPRKLRYRVSGRFTMQCPEHVDGDVLVDLDWDGDPDNMPTRAQILNQAFGANPDAELDNDVVLDIYTDVVKDEHYIDEYIDLSTLAEPPTIYPINSEMRPLLGGKEVLVVDGAAYPKRGR